MKIFNTITGQKEEFIPITPGEIKIYACGPTVYNYIHIGNARPACVFDALRRYLEYRGYSVKFVQNYTDVDDKIIRRANEEGVSSVEISEKYISEYQTDAQGLNILPASVHPKVTENISTITDIIETLEDKGCAYAADGDVYFHTDKFDGYGKLSHMPLEDLEAGARVETGEQKQNPMDFALWKAAKPGEPAWDSRWGKGRPGWHIECSAMALRYLGKTIDIHCGGQDLIFPHHENEIAQSEAANGVPFSNYWMHNGYINIDNHKMSKSAGNFFTVRDVAEQFGYEPLRFMMLSAHYRSPINYSTDIIKQSKAALERLYNFKNSLKFAAENAVNGDIDPELKTTLDGYKANFIEAMEDDFNTAGAIGAVFDFVRTSNPYIAETGVAKGAVDYIAALFGEFTGVLGLLEDKPEEVPARILELIEGRKEARQRKDYAAADAIRDEITELGYVVEETRQGTRVYKKS